MQRPRRPFCTSARRIYFAGLLLQFALTTGLSLTAKSSSAQQPSNSPGPALVDNLDGQTPKLRPPTAESGFRVGPRSIDRRTFRYGNGAERVLVRGPAGQTAEIVYNLQPAPVIPELRIAVDLVTNRPGIRLAARVVLPRSLNPSTGQPFELLVRGVQLGAGRNWEQLTLDNLPQHLANHARVARAQHRIALDERGAYVSQIVFLAPGGTGNTELLVDRVQVFGVVSARPQLADASPVSRATFQAPGRPSLASATNPITQPVQRSAGVPRIVEWRGEPFEFLQKLGFDCLSMERLPTADELKQLQRLGLTVFCPPPSPDELPDKAITAAHAAVLAWNLGDQRSTADLAQVERWEQLVSRHDPVESRPTVLAPQLNTLESSRIANVLLVGRAVVGTNLTIREHTAWLAQRQRLARPGTSTWTKIETQPSRRHRLQIAALGTVTTQSTASSYAQLTALTSAAFGIKTRGIYFESQEPLDDKGPTTRQRALAMELTNLRVQLVEPWLLAGKEVSSARSTQPQLSAMIMQAERSHLLVPVWWQQDLQSAIHPRSAGPLSFVVPGVAESSEAFLVTPGGIQRVRHRRVTGGVRVSLEELPLDGFLLLSDDQRAIAQITRYVRRIAPRAAKLRRELVAVKLQAASSLVTRMGSLSSSPTSAQAMLQQAEAELSACDRQLQAGNYQQAYLQADALELALDRLADEIFSKSGVNRSLAAESLQHASISLPDRVQLQRQLARAPLSTNLLRGGGFEDLNALLEYGWRHKQLSLDGITTSVRLSPDSPHSGSYCLELDARALDASAPMTIVPTAPVWISSHPLLVSKGDLLEITGLVRLPEPLIGTVDGLQIIDTIGGTEMALRIQDAPAWQPFRIVRAATSDTPVSVTIALTGLGKAHIDDVAVRVVRQ